MRTWLISLRGAKISLFLLSAMSLTLLISVSFPRPVSAEDFLSKTVRCVVGVLYATDCRTAPAQPTQQPEQAQQPAPSSSNSNAGRGGDAPATPAQQVPGASNPGASSVEPAPIEAPAAIAEPAMPLPNPTHRVAYGITASDYAAFIFRTGTMDVKGVSTVANVPVESTKEGWRIFGISWHWWVVGFALVVAAILWLKHGKFKNSFSVVKDS